MKRRRFLQHVAAGSAVVAFPAVLTGCDLKNALQRPSATVTTPEFDTFSVDERTIRRCLDALSTNAPDIADVFLQHRVSHAIDFGNGEVRDAVSSVTRGAGLRAVAGDQTGFATTEDLSAEALVAAAMRASKASLASSPATSATLSRQVAHDLYTIALPWSEVDLPRKQALLMQLETLLRDAEASVTDVSMRWVDQDEQVLIGSDSMDYAFDTRPLLRLSLTVTLERGGVTQSGFASISARRGIDWLTDTQLQSLAEVALNRARDLFDAIQPPTGEMPVILAAGTSGVLMHEAIGHSLEADFMRDGVSPFAGQFGARVAADFVTLKDQADLPFARGALNVDDEGMPTGTTALIEEGLLSASLHDRTTAKQAGQATSGSGRRASYRELPLPRMTCTYLDNGPHQPDEIEASVERGILCEAYTGGQVSPGAGDFVFGVRNGWLIERGKRVAPITGVNLVGNGPEMLKNITMLGNDRTMDAGGWSCGKQGQTVPVSEGMPTALVANLNVRRSDE